MAWRMPIRSSAQLATDFVGRAAQGNIEEMQLLLNAGVNVNVVSPRTAETALSTAVFHQNPYPDVIRWLLEHGANIHARDKNGITILEHAQFCGYTQSVKIIQQWIDKQSFYVAHIIAKRADQSDPDDETANSDNQGAFMALPTDIIKHIAAIIRKSIPPAQ